MIHMASVWVPFTSESKEAIADYDDIRKEMQLALQECGRKLGQYIRRRQRMRRDAQKRDVFERYIGEIAKACNHLTNVDTKQFYDALLEQAKARTEIADAQLDDEGNFIKDDHGRLAKADDVIILDSVANPDATPDGDDSTVEAKPTKKRSAKKASKKKRSTKQNTKSALIIQAECSSSTNRMVMHSCTGKLGLMAISSLRIQGAVGSRGGNGLTSTGLHVHARKADRKVVVETPQGGYAEIALEDHWTLTIQQRMTGDDTADLDHRNELINELDNMLGWIGAGHVDGGDIGSGTINVFAFVVALERALCSNRVAARIW
ncbi:MAG: hypothetical protein R3B67_00630 [Phycisphaerales bacterium]